MDVIEQFVLEFDRVHQRVAFSPLFSGREFIVPGERTCGLSISFRQQKRLVRDVLPGRAPAKAGMKRGDTIVAINGRDAELVTYRQWDEARARQQRRHDHLGERRRTALSKVPDRRTEVT